MFKIIQKSGISGFISFLQYSYSVCSSLQLNYVTCIGKIFFSSFHFITFQQGCDIHLDIFIAIVSWWDQIATVDTAQ